MFDPRTRSIRRLILYVTLLFYCLVRLLQRPHDLLGYIGYGLMTFLLVLELIESLKERLGRRKDS